MIEVLYETVGQYTGLTDKNGKKIFEGDIIKCHIGILQVFYYGNGCIMLGDKDKDEKYFMYGIINANAICECEVMGNTHDNPELLEVNNGTN